MSMSRWLIALAVLVAAAIAAWPSGRPAPGTASEARPLLLYCAAGVRAPVQEIAARYQSEHGVTIDLQFGGSGTLLGNLEVSRRGDLYLAADANHLQLAVRKGLVRETIPVANQALVLLVAKGNPKRVRGLADLQRADVRAALPDPGMASSGKVLRRLLERKGEWQAVEARVAVFKPTVNDVANDVLIGAVDVGVVWDPLVRAYPGLEAVRTPELDGEVEEIGIGVLDSAAQPAAALRFARYLAAADRGQQVFAAHGYRTAPGDAWAERPELVLYSGALNRLAIERTLAEFEQREGCTVNVTFNGCGILVTQMEATRGGAAFPDAYLSCDLSYHRPVQDRFVGEAEVSRAPVVILVRRGKEAQVRSLADLAAPGLMVGLANPEQSSLGGVTMRLLEGAGVREAVLRNVRVQAPTADLLVNQLQTGALDAVVVYRANASRVLDRCVAIDLDAAAVQTYAVSRTARHPRLAQRLLRHLEGAASRQRYADAGFTWRQP